MKTMSAYYLPVVALAIVGATPLQADIIQIDLSIGYNASWFDVADPPWQYCAQTESVLCNTPIGTPIQIDIDTGLMTSQSASSIYLTSTCQSAPCPGVSYVSPIASPFLYNPANTAWTSVTDGVSGAEVTVLDDYIIEIDSEYSNGTDQYVWFLEFEFPIPSPDDLPTLSLYQLLQYDLANYDGIGLINQSSGTVSGTAYGSDYSNNGYVTGLDDITPEPPSVAMICIGAAALICWGRKRAMAAGGSAVIRSPL